MNKRVEGSYVRVDDALHAVQRLREEGYSKKEIYVVANSTVKDSIPYTMDAEVSTDTDLRDDINDGDRSLWDKIKDAFTMDDYETEQLDQPDYDSNNDPLSQYHDEIEQGNVVVLVDDDATPSMSGGTTPTTTTDTTTAVMGGGMGAFGPSAPLNPVTTDTDEETVDYKTDPPLYEDETFADVPATDVGTHDHNLNDEDETIELREEHLDVNKDKVQTGEVRVGKRVTEETKNIEVPVTHEEVTIERHPVTDKGSTTGAITDTDYTEEIVVPVTEEQLDVSKHTEVVEEVNIRKDKVTENKQVMDTVRKEELDVDHDGDVTVQDDIGKMTPDENNNSDRPM